MVLTWLLGEGAAAASTVKLPLVALKLINILWKEIQGECKCFLLEFSISAWWIY